MQPICIRITASVAMLLAIFLYSIVCVVAISASDYINYMISVNRYPGLVANASINSKFDPSRLPHGVEWYGDVFQPKSSMTSTYGPYSAYTTLPNNCFLYELQMKSLNNTDNSLYVADQIVGIVGPIQLNNWRPWQQSGKPIKWYEWMCVTDVNGIVNVAANRTTNFRQDILPNLYTATWNQRNAWGTTGFINTLCRNVDNKWLYRDQQNVQYAGFVRSTDTIDNYYGCFEQTMGFKHFGLPKLPGQVNDLQFINPTIQYYCVNHTVFFDAGNNPDPSSSDFTETVAHTLYDIRCFSYDKYADTYLDDQGNVKPGVKLPGSIDCSQATGDGSMLKMVEVCTYTARIGVNAGDRLSTAPEWSCESRCRYPCQTTAPHRTYASQQVSAICPPDKRSSLCNTNILDNPLLFCDPSETLSAYQVNPSRVLNTFANEITTQCPIGTLGCRVDCHCRGTGCKNHPKCNGHGTLWDSSIRGLNGLSPTCMCETGYTNDFCQDKVSDTICNHGQEVTP
jgi:hypothetical protein